MTILRLPPAADPVLSVVMVTYGGWDWPLRALAALEEHTLVPFEAICIDNASRDGTGELLEDLADGLLGPAVDLGDVVRAALALDLGCRGVEDHATGRLRRAHGHLSKSFEITAPRHGGEATIEVCRKNPRTRSRSSGSATAS